MMTSEAFQYSASQIGGAAFDFLMHSASLRNHHARVWTSNDQGKDEGPPRRVNSRMKPAPESAGPPVAEMKAGTLCGAPLREFFSQIIIDNLNKYRI
jgi:hypothetical protein